MDNFSVFLSVLPSECQIQNNQIIINKQLSNRLNLNNYSVSLLNFNSVSENYSKGDKYIVIRGLDKYYDGLVLDDITEIKVPINIGLDSNDQLNKKISIYFKVYGYMLHELAYRNSDRVKNINFTGNQILIFKNKNNINKFVTYTFLEDASQTHKEFLNHAEEFDRDYNSLIQYINNLSAELKIKISVKEIDTYLKSDGDLEINQIISNKFTEITKDIYKVFTRLENDKKNYLDSFFKFRISNARFLTLIANGTSLEFFYNSNDVENPEYLEFRVNEDISFDLTKNNAILIESDIIQPQYFNNQIKKILCIINNDKKVSGIYYRVNKRHLTSINITLSYLNNSFNINELLKDYIYLHLHFKKNELE